jgi:hypothetical protein
MGILENRNYHVHCRRVLRLYELATELSTNVQRQLAFSRTTVDLRSRVWGHNRNDSKVLKLGEKRKCQTPFSEKDSAFGRSS